MNKPTVILGASDNAERYSYKATVSLKNHGHKVYPIGIKEGSILTETILTGKPKIESVDTVTLYVSPKNQSEWVNYILDLKPKRVIFNPGTENEELFALFNSHNIECIEACTLVMLSVGNY